MTAPWGAAPLVPRHWSPEQALAVNERLHALPEELWLVYGSQVQQARLEQITPEGDLPNFDPDAPF